MQINSLIAQRNDIFAKLQWFSLLTNWLAIIAAVIGLLSHWEVCSDITITNNFELLLLLSTITITINITIREDKIWFDPAEIGPEYVLPVRLQNSGKEKQQVVSLYTIHQRNQKVETFHPKYRIFRMEREKPTSSLRIILEFSFP